MKKQRVLSGIRPTGKLHWGNYFGAIKNWVELQKDYECFFCIADWHALTSEYAKPQAIPGWTWELYAEILACGVDPEKSTFFIQSHVPEHAELHLILSMFTPLGWLERVPTYKEMRETMAEKDLNTYGFLGYPVLQAADILIYNAHKIPVGEDQVSHLELIREMVRRFHFITGKKTFVEPQPLLTKSPRVPGIDRRKMSKSFDNAIWLDDPPEVIRKKLMQALTDPARVRREDKGNPDVCTVFDDHKLVSDLPTVGRVNRECRTAEIGCVDCKKLAAGFAIDTFKEFREKKAHWLTKSKQLREMAAEGSKRARKVAQENLGRVKEALGW